MTEQQLFMPSPELVEQLRSEAPHGIRDMGATRERYLIHAAYRAGADQGLEVCCEWLDKGPYGFSIVAPGLTRSLRAALRPAPAPQVEGEVAAVEQFKRAQPVPVSEHPWERTGWCDEHGRCWFGAPRDGAVDAGWILRKPSERLSHQTASLPAHALPLPSGEVE